MVTITSAVDMLQWRLVEVDGEIRMANRALREALAANLESAKTIAMVGSTLPDGLMTGAELAFQEVVRAQLECQKLLRVRQELEAMVVEISKSKEVK